MRFGKLQFRGKPVGLFKIAVALSWKAGDNVRADGDPWDKALGCRNDAVVTSAVIAACHSSQYVIRTTLHWQVEMAAHARIFPQFQPLQAKIFGFQGRDANARYVGFSQKRGDQVTKVMPFLTIRVIVFQMNACQYNFLEARAYLALYMLHDRFDAAAA